MAMSGYLDDFCRSLLISSDDPNKTSVPVQMELTNPHTPQTHTSFSGPLAQYQHTVPSQQMPQILQNAPVMMMPQQKMMNQFPVYHQQIQSQYAPGQVLVGTPYSAPGYHQNFQPGLCENYAYRIGWQNTCYHRPTGNSLQSIKRTITKKKRHRTAYTTDQINALEAVFISNGKYLSKELRKDLSQRLRIDEKCIKVWFQNRRMKLKHESSECDSSSSYEPISSPEYNTETLYFPQYNNNLQENNHYNQSLSNDQSNIIEREIDFEDIFEVLEKIENNSNHIQEESIG